LTPREALEVPVKAASPKRKAPSLTVWRFSGQSKSQPVKELSVSFAGKFRFRYRPRVLREGFKNNSLREIS
jgi:hypothetical protein